MCLMTGPLPYRETLLHELGLAGFIQEFMKQTISDARTKVCTQAARSE